QVGDVKKDTIEMEWAVTLTINLATLSYKDEELESRIKQGISEQISGITSMLMTVRLALPVGLDFLANQLIDSAFDLIELQMISTVQDMGVSDFHRTGDTSFKNVHGETVKAHIYEGTLNYDGSIRVKGVLAIWGSDGSIVATAGFVPYEDLTYTTEIVTKTFLKIDGDAEFDEVITLMQNVA
ncbi:MAG: hypothetical protein QMD78_01510, partial [Methanocellales archaeon]|nr:hypothetical protein [Methanocellales archaeon]